MKATTTQIYNLITSENFVDIKNKLVGKVKEHSWTIPDRQEYSYNELMDELPDSIDMIRQNIEDTTFDVLPYSVRHSIFNTMNQINGHLQNIYANHQQFANLQDLTQALKTLIRTNRLDFEAKRIPRYKEKIKEYSELIIKLQELNNTLDVTKTKKDELDEVLETAQKTLSELVDYVSEAKEEKENISSKLESSNELFGQISAMLETIKEYRENTVEILQEAKSSNSNIKEKEEELNSFYEKIEDYKSKMTEFIKASEEKINVFTADTDSIIATNASQQIEIDNQLNKAVGASLFSTFAVRKDDLNKNLNNWLIALGVIITILIGLSGWIAYDIIGAETNWYKVLIKIGISVPLVYMLAFISSRYTKERRLVEEYAFKSTISLALTPYADLIKKIEDEGADSKYRDFLISSIENIFSAPTDKAFGFNKHTQPSKEQNNSKIVEDVLNMIGKAKKIGQD